MEVVTYKQATLLSYLLWSLGGVVIPSLILLHSAPGINGMPLCAAVLTANAIGYIHARLHYTNRVAPSDAKSEE